MQCLRETYCNDELVIEKIRKKQAINVGRTQILLQKPAVLRASEGKILKAFSAKTSAFNQFTHQKERSISYLKLAVDESLSEDNILFERVHKSSYTSRNSNRSENMSHR